MSVFLCLPQGEEEVYSRWQRLMIYALSDALITTPGKPVKGDVLISLDEFLSLSKMKRLEDGMEALAGAGGKLFIAVQKLGRLKETYGKNWETFISGAGCQIWFSPDSLEVAQYLEKLLGEAEIIRTAESQNSSESSTTTTTRSEAEGSTQTHGTADQTGRSDSTSRSAANTEGTSQNRQKGSSFQYGTQRGTNQGTSKEPHFIFAPLRSGTQSGSSYSSNSNRGRNTSSGTGSHKSSTETLGSSQSTSSSHTVNESFAQSRTTTQSEALAQGETTGRGTSQTFHKKPLLTVNEMNRLLPSYDDIDDDRYPGFALIRIAGEDPFVVRKCYYDQDIAFGRRFSPHPDHAFFPQNRLPMLGYQITDEHFLDIFLPDPALLAKHEVSIERYLLLEEGREYWADEELPIAFEVQKPEWVTLHWPLPKAGKVLSIGDGRNEPLISMRLREPMTQNDVATLRQSYWGEITAPLLQSDRQERESIEAERLRNQRQEDERRRRAEEHAEKERQTEQERAEKERLAKVRAEAKRKDRIKTSISETEARIKKLKSNRISEIRGIVIDLFAASIICSVAIFVLVHAFSQYVLRIPEDAMIAFLAPAISIFSCIVLNLKSIDEIKSINKRIRENQEKFSKLNHSL